MNRPHDLPLFRRAELSVLQERREALLKRIQGLQPDSHGRGEILGPLRFIAAEILALENQGGAS